MGWPPPPFMCQQSRLFWVKLNETFTHDRLKWNERGLTVSKKRDWLSCSPCFCCFLMRNPTFHSCNFTFLVPATLCLLSFMNFIASSSFFHCDLLGGSIGTRRVFRIPWISSGSRDMLTVSPQCSVSMSELLLSSGSNHHRVWGRLRLKERVSY